MDLRSFSPFTLNIRGNIHRFDQPAVMGIVNITPDSFYAPSRTQTREDVIRQTEIHISQGADIIDVGAYSSRPGAEEVSESEEMRRLETALEAIRSVAPDIPLSVDTFRAKIAREAITNLGADIVNDIGGGNLDPDMFETIAELRAPYILMHMRGTPATMQSFTDYNHVTVDVISALSSSLARLEELGANDIIIDPGLGFSKTTEQNYTLLRDLPSFSAILRKPILIGLSRKSMLTRPLGITPSEALSATTCANTLALINGAAILRVHDVKPAVEARTIVSLFNSNT